MSTIATRLAFTNIAAGTNPRSVNITLGSGTSRKLVVVAANETTGAATIDSATFDGTSLTSFSSRTAASMRVRWFYYDIPDGKANGTYAINVTLSSDAGALSVAAWITNSDTAGAPQISTDDLAGGDATGSANIPSLANDALLTAYFDPTSGNTASATSSQVTLANSNNISTSGFRAHKYDAIGDATETVTVTWTPSTTTGEKTFAVVNTTPAVVGPTITVQPVADVGIISNGQSTVYTATATGTNVDAPTWSEDGTPISDGGIYDIVTTGAGTSSCSSTLTITRTVKTGTPFDIKANFADDNGNTDTNTVTDTWWTGPSVTTFPATDGDGESTATLTCDYVTGVGEAIEVRIPLSDGDVAVTVTTT